MKKRKFPKSFVKSTMSISASVFKARKQEKKESVKHGKRKEEDGVERQTEKSRKSYKQKSQPTLDIRRKRKSDRD